MSIHDTTLQLTKQLVARRSVTPDDGGCLELIAARLSRAGFACERIDRGEVKNLWAVHGQGAPVICLAGHVDVVPPGPVERWKSDPFEPTERDGSLFGRGAADMKSAVAAMVTAAERVVASAPDHAGSVALLLTSDEEGRAIDGTAAVVQELTTRGVRIAACIVGEPTSVERLGDTIKVGRRGSLNGVLSVKGVQCHIAYPERGRNPVHAALPALAELSRIEWGHGDPYFAPTSFQISHVHASTGANNTIPPDLEVWFNFRFSPEVTVAGLKEWVASVLDAHGVEYDLAWSLSGEPFLTPRGALVDALGAAIRSVTEAAPELSTSGGTSDGRFLARVSEEIAEFGPVGASIHAIDEHVALADLAPLSVVYERTVARLLRSGRAPKR